ncbi:hypothetical protein T02_4925 [Trichinella nativa]|uniref:Uncharacterized protein n=1 Tax=Trichinella nativa TaxID=6335 RepID=A0A0V1KXU0_9BILA|nr:hypothetical protein T02_4925 [Trichinella nativa]
MVQNDRARMFSTIQVASALNKEASLANRLS